MGTNAAQLKGTVVNLYHEHVAGPIKVKMQQAQEMGRQAWQQAQEMKSRYSVKAHNMVRTHAPSTVGVLARAGDSYMEWRHELVRNNEHFKEMGTLFGTGIAGGVLGLVVGGLCYGRDGAELGSLYGMTTTAVIEIAILSVICDDGQRLSGSLERYLLSGENAEFIKFFKKGYYVNNVGLVKSDPAIRLLADKIIYGTDVEFNMIAAILSEISFFSSADLAQKMCVDLQRDIGWVDGYKRFLVAEVRKNITDRLDSNTLSQNPDVVRRRLELMDSHVAFIERGFFRGNG